MKAKFRLNGVPCSSSCFWENFPLEEDVRAVKSALALRVPVITFTEANGDVFDIIPIYE